MVERSVLTVRPRRRLVIPHRRVIVCAVLPTP